MAYVIHDPDPLPGMSMRELTELGVMQVQNSISSIDEVREKLDLTPWGIPETSEPVMFTPQGPIPLSMAPQLMKQTEEIKKLKRLVQLLIDCHTRNEEINFLRRELDL